ncbi:MAG TPA: hypothetical protein VF786_08175 [Terriglobales bacterium]
MSDWRYEFTGDPACDFTMNVLVDGSSYAAHRRPFFRGLHHIVIAKFDDANVFVFDVLRRTVSAVVTQAVALDRDFWEGTVLPLIVGVLGAAIKVLPVHCACLSIDSQGLLIAGVSGSGKSTLSVALAQAGLTFLSDDWTYISSIERVLIAHGMSAPIKLLPDAVAHFPSILPQPLKRTLNGEFAYELHPEKAMGLTVERVCEPRWLVFPERGELLESELIPLPTSHIRAYLEENVEVLPPQLVRAEQERQHLISKLSELPAWRFQYRGTPQFAAGELIRLLANGKRIAA